MSKKPIDWLLKEDIFNLRQGLETADEYEDAEAAFHASDEILDDLEPEEPEPGTIAAAAATVQPVRRPISLVWVLLLFVVIAGGAGGVLLMMPPSALGPLEDLAATLQGTKRPDLNSSDAPAQPGALQVKNDQIGAAGSIPGTTSATTSATNTITDAATGAITDEIVAPDAVSFVVIGGPVTSATIVSKFAEDGMTATVTSVEIRNIRRQVSSSLPSPPSDVDNAATELRSQGVTFTVEALPGGHSITIAPLPPQQADAAAKVLVTNGIQPTAEDSEQVDVRQFINVGPFAEEYLADQTRAKIAQEYNLPTAKKIR